MIVKITYDDQRLDVFDTSTFTAGLPLGKANMLTNFEVRFDTMGEGGLWLAAHSYQACGEHEDEDGEIPVARRTKGWRFLLSSAEELEHVELVVVDGEAIIKRVLGHLIDLQSLRMHGDILCRTACADSRALRIHAGNKRGRVPGYSGCGQGDGRRVREGTREGKSRKRQRRRDGLGRR